MSFVWLANGPIILLYIITEKSHFSLGKEYDQLKKKVFC